MIKGIIILYVFSFLFVFYSCNSNSRIWTEEKIKSKCKGSFLSEFDASQFSNTLTALDSNEVNYFHKRGMFLNCNRLEFYSLIKGLPDCFVIRIESLDTIWCKLLQFDGQDLYEVYTLSLYTKPINKIQNPSITDSDLLKTDFKTTYFQGSTNYLVTETYGIGTKLLKLLVSDSIKNTINEVLALNWIYKKDSLFHINESTISGKYIRVRYLTSKEIIENPEYNKNENDSIYYLSNEGLVNISNKGSCSEMDSSTSVFFLLNDSLGVYRHIEGKDTILLKTDRNGYVPHTMNEIKIYGANGGVCYLESDNLIATSNLKLDVIEGLLFDNTDNYIIGHELNHLIIKEQRDYSSEYMYFLSISKSGELISLFEIFHHLVDFHCRADRGYERVPSNINVQFKMFDSWYWHDDYSETGGESEGIVTIKDNGNIEKKILKETKNE